MRSMKPNRTAKSKVSNETKNEINETNEPLEILKELTTNDSSSALFFPPDLLTPIHEIRIGSKPLPRSKSPPLFESHSETEFSSRVWSKK
jgi:hypothetical protein